jgi:hypothetical protein
MNRKLLSLSLLLSAAFGLSSCSGVKQVCSVNCINPGNANVSFVLTATPPDPALQVNIHAYAVVITGITLTPASGPDFSIPLNATTYFAEFNRVTSDSTLLAVAATVPAANYTQVKITYSAPRVTFCTQGNFGVPGCADNTLAYISGAAGSATASANLSFGANQQTGVVINADLGKTLTLTGQAVTAVNLGAANVFTAATLPPAATATDLSSGQLSHLDDVMGTITAINSQSVTLQTTTRGSITAIANSSTQFATSCASPSITGCIHVNDVAIIDSVLNADGTLSMTFYQPLFASSVDLLEGVVTSVPNSILNTVNLVVTDAVFANSGSVLTGQLGLGDKITVGLSSAQPFAIVSKGLNIPVNGFTNSTSISALQPGQTVAFPVSSFLAASGATNGAAITNTFLLRFTRVSAVAGGVTSPIFNGTTLPPFFGLAVAEQFQTTSSHLSLDGVSNLGSLPISNTFSTTTLFLGTPAAPAFASQTVRAH